jgi:hypothetical protein
MAMRRNTAAGELLASDVCGADDEVAAVGLVDEQPGSLASAMRSSTGSSPGGVIRIVLPTAKGPRSRSRVAGRVGGDSMRRQRAYESRLLNQR